MDTYAASGLVRFEYNHLAFIGPESQRAAEATECANEQGYFWQYHDTLFQNQRGENLGAFSDEHLKNMATRLELNMNEFNACFDSGRYQNLVIQDRNRANDLGITSTPSFTFNGEVIAGGLPFEQFQALIEAQLASAG